MDHFLTDVQTLRQRIDEGVVPSGYNADRETVLKVFADSPETEVVCILRYRRHHFMAKAIQLKRIADEFLVHSNREQGRDDQLVEGIAIDSYRDIIQYLDDKDPTTQRKLESVLAVEEELADLLQAVPAGLTAKPPAAIKSS